MEIEAHYLFPFFNKIHQGDFFNDDNFKLEFCIIKFLFENDFPNIIFKITILSL